MHYSLCEFNYGYVGQFYIEEQFGNIIRFVDLSGNTIICPGCGEEGWKPYGWIILDSNPVQPIW